MRAIVYHDHSGILRLRLDGDAADQHVRDRASSWVWWSDTRPHHAALRTGILVFGEMLPGSRSVALRPDVASIATVVTNRAYMILLPPGMREDWAVVFRDPAGQIVPWPNPQILKRGPAEPDGPKCQAGNSPDWDTVDIRTEPDHEYYRVRGRICHACRFHYGNWMALGRRRIPRPPTETSPTT